MIRKKLVVLNECVLGWMIEGSNLVGVIHASILKGDYHTDYLSSLNPRLTDETDVIRLAGKKDFDEFNVSFEGFDNEVLYEFDKNQ